MATPNETGSNPRERVSDLRRARSGSSILEFVIRRCHIGDETSLSLLGKSTFLETYAGSIQADDLLSFVETEHSAERYRSWLESRFARLWVAEIGWGRSAIGYAVTQHGFGPRDGDQATL